MIDSFRSCVVDPVFRVSDETLQFSDLVSIVGVMRQVNNCQFLQFSPKNYGETRKFLTQKCPVGVCERRPLCTGHSDKQRFERSSEEQVNRGYDTRLRADLRVGPYEGAQPQTGATIQ